MAKPVLLTKDLSIGICEADGGTETECALLRVTIGVDFGEPESGRFGPPENYDPGSGDEVYVKAINILDASPIPHALVSTWVELWIEQNRDDLSGEAAAARADAALDEACERTRDERDFCWFTGGEDE